LRLLEHAFDTLGCSVVGWRTDNLNFRSQAAIERLGAKKDGVIRRQSMRRDGSFRDTVMYSVTSEEWNANIRARLLGFLAQASV
jgi:RimJ/RimL family protein N-acetyltransferase